MRIRKFRAKDLFSDSWIFNGQCVFIDKESKDGDAVMIHRNTGDTAYVKKNTVGELITTRNGLEYWEGDIMELRLIGIETHIEIQNAVVSYNTEVCGYGFQVLEESSGYFGWLSFYDKNIQSRKIIGNQFDDSELLPISK